MIIGNANNYSQQESWSLNFFNRILDCINFKKQGRLCIIKSHVVYGGFNQDYIIKPLHPWFIIFQTLSFCCLCCFLMPPSIGNRYNSDWHPNCGKSTEIKKNKWQSLLASTDDCMKGVQGSNPQGLKQIYSIFFCCEVSRVSIHFIKYQVFIINNLDFIHNHTVYECSIQKILLIM